MICFVYEIMDRFFLLGCYFNNFFCGLLNSVYCSWLVCVGICDLCIGCFDLSGIVCLVWVGGGIKLLLVCLL